jgi:hypothetical protein
MSPVVILVVETRTGGVGAAGFDRRLKYRNKMPPTTRITAKMITTCHQWRFLGRGSGFAGAGGVGCGFAPVGFSSAMTFLSINEPNLNPPTRFSIAEGPGCRKSNLSEIYRARRVTD